MKKNSVLPVFFDTLLPNEKFHPVWTFKINFVYVLHDIRITIFLENNLRCKFTKEFKKFVKLQPKLIQVAISLLNHNSQI